MKMKRGEGDLTKPSFCRPRFGQPTTVKKVDHGLDRCAASQSFVVPGEEARARAARGCPPSQIITIARDHATRCIQD